MYKASFGISIVAYLLEVSLSGEILLREMQFGLLKYFWTQSVCKNNSSEDSYHKQHVRIFAHKQLDPNLSMDKNSGDQIIISPLPIKFL